jgi:hypothetical protein
LKNGVRVRNGVRSNKVELKVAANVDELDFDLKVKGVDDTVDRILKERDDVANDTFVLVDTRRRDECGAPSSAIYTLKF